MANITPILTQMEAATLGSVMLQLITQGMTVINNDYSAVMVAAGSISGNTAAAISSASTATASAAAASVSAVTSNTKAMESANSATVAVAARDTTQGLIDNSIGALTAATVAAQGIVNGMNVMIDTDTTASYRIGVSSGMIFIEEA